MERVSGRQLEPYIERVASELGATNGRRLRAFLEVGTESDGSYAFSKVFAALFPDVDRAKALESFKKFRADVNRAADVAHCPFRIAADESKTPRLEDRRCWFEGGSIENPELAVFANDSSRPSDREVLGKSMAIASGPPVYSIFVSYAHDDKSLVFDLLDRLRPRLKALSGAKPYDVSLWQDHNIAPGDRWKREIRMALKECRLGLLMLSPSFLASDFIANEEVPTIVSGIDDFESAKPCIPLMAREFDLKIYKDALGGIAEYQIYRYYHSNNKIYAWNRCACAHVDDRFLDDLADRLIKRLDRIHENPTQPAVQLPIEALPDALADSSCNSAAFALLAARHEIDITGIQKVRANPSDLKNLNRILAKEPQGETGKPVVASDYLREWAARPSDSTNEFMAVLGEFGIGKTTTLKQFAQKIIEDRAADPKLPLPLLFDLRAYQRARKAEEAITLERVVASCLHAVKSDTGDPWAVTARDLIEAVRKQGAIAIFDGLDEVMTAMSEPERQELARELSSVLPPLPRKFDAANLKGRGKIVMSCRSHFFRDVTEQNGLHTGQGREGVAEEDRRSLILLPFSREQILGYLKANLGAARGAAVFERLESIHNLLDLAERPVLLNMIREIVPELERSIMAGVEIQGVDLYEHFIKKHFARDEGKHVFTTQHKFRLMEALAADLWISGERSWTWARMEEWLDDFLADHPSIASRYALDPELLNQDFRNATAVVRPAGEKSDFRFAHTSLQEYFLACLMQRSLESGDTERWAEMPLPSDETLDFLGQLLRRSDARSDVALKALAGLMERPKGKSALIGLRYLLLAQEHRFPAPSPQRLDLAGVSLVGWKFRGQSQGAPLTLKNADFAGANLSLTEWQWVRLQGANFEEATLNQSRWKNCRIFGGRFAGAKASGARYRDCRWQGPTFASSDSWTGAWLIACDGFPESSVAPFALSVAVGETWARSGSLSRQRDSHSSSVKSLAVDAARGRYVTASFDGTARVWDAESLERVGELACGSWVKSVAVDAARGRYVTGSSDGTARVWDAESLERVGELACGFWVWSVAVDAARGRYVTGSDGRTARVWDAESLERVGELACGSCVSSVAVDAARGRYVTGSEDGTALVWDAESLERVGELACGSLFLSLAVDAARGRYVTGSEDGTARVWNAESLERVGELVCGSCVSSVAVDAARGRYVTGSEDGAARVWDAESLERVGELACGSCVSSVAVDAARRRYVTGSDDRTARVWDADSLERVGELACGFLVLSVAVDAARGRYVTGSSDDTALVWDADSLERVGELACGSWVLSVAVDAARGRYVTGSSDGTARVWDAESLELLAKAWTLPESQWASIRGDGSKPIALSETAHEHLMWIARDPTTHQLKALPYEAIES